MAETPSLYRRHRPRTFDEVVGQEHVVRTLRNAVERGKVHHAYLFVGSRGTGKTSMAKILAACLNCEQGPTTTPDGTCDSCVAIAGATSLDVIEMDAASNNSVDDIRELRERVALAPVSGRSKVYILDEAHMLSPQAWNAFLKTLEEPPPDPVFVLSTTEAQKVLPTVVDRCHRFDFGRPRVEQIADVLRRVAGQEGIELPEAAVGLIARAATGSFRDALGTLEQLVTYSGQTIELDDVLAVLGVVDAELLFGAVDAVAAHDAREALQAVARLDECGRDAGQLLRDLETHARELLVVQTLGEVPGELRVTADRDERLLAQAQRLEPIDVTRLLDLVAAAQDAVKNGAEARIQLELALVKAARPDADASTQALLQRIERLEARMAGEGPQPDPFPPAAAREDEPREAVPSLEEVTVHDAREPGDELEGLRSVWPAVLETLRERSGSLKAGIFAEARPAAVSDGELIVAFPPSATFKKRKAEDRDYCEALAEAVRAVTGASIRLRCELRDEDEGEAVAGDAPAGAAAAGLSEEELVERFMAEFDAEEIPADHTEE